MSLDDRVAELSEVLLDDTYKGIPLGHSVRLGAIAEPGWNVARGDLALPVTTLHAPSIEANLRTMTDFCARHGAELAPHGKTTMAPQLFARQLALGATAMTAATPTQVAVMRRFGVPTIILANELVEPAALSWIAGELARDQDFTFHCLVDSASTVRLMDETLEHAGFDVTIPVLLEVGLSQGRAGVRSESSALQVAEAIQQARHLRLAGVEAYEGLVASGATAGDVDAVDQFLTTVADTARLLAGKNLFDADEIIVTAGGSAYFDRVVTALKTIDITGTRVRVILRSGCYVTHDDGKYARLSPLDGRSAPGERLRLRDALTGWGAVLSRPEEDLAIVGAGKRDFPFDVDLPRPHTAYRTDGSSWDIAAEAKAFKVMDQHTFLRLSPGTQLAPGDVVAFGLSHPCTAFDKLRMLPLIDDDATVVDAVVTFF
ncbi:amino acid deaminase [Streptomyces chartreusis]|uniref:amino acid deaminase n=1 Tax=Streptomyces chartreusis TaxID=1969 RepID=UPI0036AC814F